jgi:hypothetical protein
MSNYWYDNARQEVFYATVVLTSVENPNAPPMVVSVPTLLAEERFVPLLKSEVADTLKQV